MPLPFEFEPGLLAKANEVNANFTWVIGVLGVDSTSTRLRPPSDLVLGPRANAQITSNQDEAVGAANSYLHLGWNAETYKDGSVWKVRRFASGETASALRLGRDGLSFLTTSRTTGDLDVNIQKVFGVRATSGSDFVYLTDGWHFQRYDGDARNIEDYRQTYVHMDSPTAIYGGAGDIQKQTIVKPLGGLGVPSTALGVQVLLYGRAKGTKASVVKVMQERNSRSFRQGTVLVMQAGQENATEGYIPIGLGAHAGKIVVEISAPLEWLHLIIKGYYT